MTLRSRVRAVLGSLLCTGLVLSAVAVAPPAQARAVSQSYWVPADGPLVVRGHGYGHGHGMSQYGAYGAARQGLTYEQILDFYYPGTSRGTAARTIRVLITSDTTSDVQVEPAAGLRLRDRGSGTVYRLPHIDGVRRWRINPDGARNVVGYLTDRWRRWSPGGRAALVGEGQFVADGPLTLVTPSGRRTYRGALRAASPAAGSGSRDTVNVLSLDAYVRGVIPYEMPASWPAEAVRSQAVAARTYAAWARAEEGRGHYDICDTTACQVYGGVAGEHPLSDAAARATAGVVLRYGGSPAFTQFSSSSGGWTSAGSRPYLVAQADPYDDHDRNPMHDWTTEVTATQIARAYPALGTLRRIRVTERDGNGQWHGRVRSLVLDGTRADVALTGDDFRWAFGLRSTWFRIDATPITRHWRSLGGKRSVLGRATAREVTVPGGVMQRFAGGRIWWSTATGANEVHGPVLEEYRRLGYSRSGARGPGLPRTGVQAKRDGVRVRFQRGTIYSHAVTGTHALLGRVSQRYRRYGGVFSALGWPVSGTYPVESGERADFEHGRVEWDRETDRTRVVLAG